MWSTFLENLDFRNDTYTTLRYLTGHVQEVFHVYLNKFENVATNLFLVIFGNN